MTRRVFVDTAVLLYAVGGEHAERAACRAIIEAAAAGQVELHASVELVQEFLFHRLRRSDRRKAVAQTGDVRDLLVLHSFDRPVVDTMIDLVETSGIGGRDAVHAATALVAGFEEIVSTDPDLDAVTDLRRVAPADLEL